jgi:4-carboxymuconolactone decarboxylase
MKRPSGGRGKQLAKVVPLLNQITQEMLYDVVWERPLLSKRERSLLTLAVLISQGKEQTKGHMETAMDNGLTVEELGEAITHLAFYAGWPSAVVAARKLLELAEERQAAEQGEDAK